MTKAVAYITRLAQTRKLLGFSRQFKLSYVYLWQLKTPKTDAKGRPLRDPESGRIIYRRSPSFRTINRLKEAIPTEYWYEEESGPPADPERRPRRRAAPTAPSPLPFLDDDPFCGVVSPWRSDPALTDRSGRFAFPPAKIVLDFPADPQ